MQISSAVAAMAAFQVCPQLFVRVAVTAIADAVEEMVPRQAAVVLDECAPLLAQAKGPLNASLSDHFFAKFRRGSQECKAAQRAFAESMAAYSLVCYFLQIKVRSSHSTLSLRQLRTEHCKRRRKRFASWACYGPLVAPCVTLRRDFLPSAACLTLPGYLASLERDGWIRQPSPWLHSCHSLRMPLSPEQ